MAPPSGLQQSAISTDSLDAPFPALARSSTLPTTFQQARRTDPSHLAPEDAFYAASPPRRLSAFDNGDNGSGTEMRSRRLRHKIDGESRSRSRRRKRTWKKLLWVKQSCQFRRRRAIHLSQSPDKLFRSGQLYRPGHLPREPPAESATAAIRFLALSRRLDGHCAARLLGHHIRRVFRWHLPGAA